MRGRLTLLILSGALLAGCSSSGVTGSGKDTASTAGSHASTPATGSSSSPAAPASSASGSASGSAPVTGAGPLPGEDATVVVGVGKTQVTIYEDYRCPPCKDVHDKIQPALAAALATSSVKVEYHAVALVDHTKGGKGSLTAANAASCAFKVGKFQPYREALFAGQPVEDDDAYAQPDKLISVAKGLDGLDTPGFEDCVRNQPYAGSIQNTYDSTIGAGKFPGVPAIFINGKQWQIPASGDLAAAFTQAVQAG